MKRPEKLTVGKVSTCMRDMHEEGVAPMPESRAAWRQKHLFWLVYDLICEEGPELPAQGRGTRDPARLLVMSWL